jgi:hypothetical protein
MYISCSLPSPFKFWKTCCFFLQTYRFTTSEQVRQHCYASMTSRRSCLQTDLVAIQSFKSQMCTDSCPWCSAVTCLACLLLQRAATPRARVPAGSGGRRSPPMPSGFALGMWVQPRALLTSDIVLVLVVRCLLFLGSVGLIVAQDFS